MSMGKLVEERPPFALAWGLAGHREHSVLPVGDDQSHRQSHFGLGLKVSPRRNRPAIHSTYTQKSTANSAARV